jgi:molybdenum cofactor cytidylyltransferase
VLVTATSHLAAEQLNLADRHYFVDDDLLEQVGEEILPGTTLITGPLDVGTNRTLGLTAGQVDRIYGIAETHQIPLLIEADGSRQLPLKAPADHEPPIPGFVDLAVVVAGLNGLGQSLTPEWVHRTEIFSALSGLELGDVIVPEALARVLLHPEGGLKNIPPNARRIALLNQADTPELQARAGTLRSVLLQTFDAVIISSLAPYSSISNLQSPIFASHESIAAVILAAGASRRFGSPKQLLAWHGKPLIWHVARKALRAGLGPVVVVCGQELVNIQEALKDLPVEFVFNPNWQQGQGLSVKAGAEAIGSRCGGILFMLADQPQIPAPLIRSLVREHAESLHPIIGPLVDGQRANPVLFDRVTFDDLAALSGLVGGRKLFGKYPVRWIPWHDPAPLLDVDTLEDYQHLLEMMP